MNETRLVTISMVVTSLLRALEKIELHGLIEKGIEYLQNRNVSWIKICQLTLTFFFWVKSRFKPSKAETFGKYWRDERTRPVSVECAEKRPTICEGRFHPIRSRNLAMDSSKEITCNIGVSVTIINPTTDNNNFIIDNGL
ncbi:MAG: hypothetical protein AAF720_01480 [Pseudomonadota bacterium]